MNTPWILKQLPTGEWSLEQVWQGRKRRFGIFKTREEALPILAELRRDK